jgi:hypothetical protein
MIHVFLLSASSVALVLVLVLVVRDHGVNRPYAWSMSVGGAALAVSVLVDLLQGTADLTQAQLLVRLLTAANLSAVAGLMVGWLLRHRRAPERS